MLQTVPVGLPQAAPGEARGIVHEAIRPPGQPLAAEARAYFEPRFGHDFRHVRVHNRRDAPESVRISGPELQSSDRGAFGEKNTPANGGDLAPAPAQRQPADVGPVPAQARPACPVGQKVGKVRGCIKPVVIADDDGKNPTSATSAAKAQEIWKKCCIEFSLDSTVTVKKASYKTLEESPNNTPTTQEEDLFKEVATSACIQVFVPATLKMGDQEGKDVNGGGGTYEGGGAHPKIVLVEGALPEVLAHEVGHAAGYRGHAGSAGTIMEPSNHYNVAPPTDVSADVCTRARSGSVLTSPGPTDCCETIP